MVKWIDDFDRWHWRQPFLVRWAMDMSIAVAIVLTVIFGIWILGGAV